MKKIIGKSIQPIEICSGECWRKLHGTKCEECDIYKYCDHPKKDIRSEKVQDGKN